MTTKPDTSKLQRLMEQFLAMPIETLTYRKIEHLYITLLDFELQNEEDFDDEFHQLLKNLLDALETSLLRRDKQLCNLKRKLIDDPAAIELILSHMNLHEVLVAEQRGKRLKSPELRQQFANMIERTLEELCERTTDAN